MSDFDLNSNALTENNNNCNINSNSNTYSVDPGALWSMQMQQKTS